MRALLLLFVVVLAAATACQDMVSPTAKPVISVRNLRVDTVASVYFTECSAASVNSSDRLQPRDLILPQAHREFAVDPGCYDAQFLNPRDSVIDARTDMQLILGDSMLVNLAR